MILMPLDDVIGADLDKAMGAVLDKCESTELGHHNLVGHNGTVKEREMIGPAHDLYITAIIACMGTHSSNVQICGAPGLVSMRMGRCRPS